MAPRVAEILADGRPREGCEYCMAAESAAVAATTTV